MSRVYNFSAGPAVLPEEVLKALMPWSEEIPDHCRKQNQGEFLCQPSGWHSYFLRTSYLPYTYQH